MEDGWIYIQPSFFMRWLGKPLRAGLVGYL